MIGFVNLFKAAGPSSARALARVRRIYALHAGERNLAAGHLGTLDPQAAGVLPVAIGKATRLIPLLADQRKSYACTLVLGCSTTTQDAQGETVDRRPVPANWSVLLEDALPSFIGRIAQTPPMFSAVRHQGKRLYELAREGKSVDRKARSVTIYGLSLLGIEPSNPSTGAGYGATTRRLQRGNLYPNALPRYRIGDRHSAHMGALLREGSGPFLLYEAHTIDEIAHEPQRALIAPENIIPFPTIVLDLRGSADFRAGRVVPLPQGATGRHVFVRDETRTLVGVGEALGALLAPRKVFV